MGRRGDGNIHFAHLGSGRTLIGMIVPPLPNHERAGQRHESARRAVSTPQPPASPRSVSSDPTPRGKPQQRSADPMPRAIVLEEVESTPSPLTRLPAPRRLNDNRPRTSDSRVTIAMAETTEIYAKQSALPSVVGATASPYDETSR